MNSARPRVRQLLLATALLPGLLLPSLRAAEALPPLDSDFPDIVDLDRVIGHLGEIAARYPARDYDLATLVAQLGNDPARAFAWVRDNIGIQPYAGMLRGAEGTLAARAGNSLDRALLLRELLSRQGLETRLATGQLSTAVLARMEQRVFETTAAAAANPEAAYAMIGLGDSALLRLYARSARDEQRLVAALGSEVGSASPGEPGRLDAQRHYWVQALVQGEWMDFDPSLREAGPGQVLASFTGSRERPAALDLHTVSLELFAESLAADGSLRRESVLQETLVAAEAALDQVFLVFLPDVPAGGSPTAGVLGRMAGQPSRFRPLLMMGNELTEGGLLPPLNQERSAAQSFFFGGGDEQGPLLVGLELELSTTYPGGERRATRRLFDRVAAEDRLAGSLDVEDLLQVEEINGTPAFLAAVHQVVVSAGAANPRRLANDIAYGIDFMGRELLDPGKFKDSSLQEMLWPIGAHNLALALVAERLSLAALNDRPGLRFFAGSPRVYLMSTLPHVRQGLTVRDNEIDLLLDHVDWSAAGELAGRDVVERRIRYGVLQQALETTLVEVAGVPLDLDTVEVTSASTRIETGLERLLPTPPEAASFAPALREDLATGLVLRSPGQHDTWWRFDPADGSLVARLAPGLGGGRLMHTLPRSSAAGGTLGELVRQPANAGNTYRLVGDRLIREGAPSGNSCAAGGGLHEYSIMMCNVSLKISLTTGEVYAIIVGEVVASVVAILLQL